MIEQNHNLLERCEMEREKPTLFLDRIRGVLAAVSLENPIYKAFLQTHPCPDLWLGQYIQQCLAKPLFGVTLAVKASMKAEGFAWDGGFKPALAPLCSEDAALVDRFRRYGAFVLGVTNLDEACLHAVGENKTHGRMRNALDVERTPLGSSGGSAVAVAKGWADIGLGTDSGGSVRAPAAACGLSSIVAGIECLPTQGSFVPGGAIDLAGVMTRNLSDLQFVLNLMEKTTGNINSDTGLHALLIPLPGDLSALCAEWREFFSRAVAKLAKNYLVQEHPLPFEEAAQARKVIITVAALRHFERERIPTQGLSLVSKAVLEFGKRVTPTAMQSAFRVQALIKERMRVLISNGTFLLAPALSSPAPLWKDVERDAAGCLGNIGYFLPLVNVAGLCAVSFPLRNSSRPIPLALQLIGKAGEESKILKAASALERELN